MSDIEFGDLEESERTMKEVRRGEVLPEGGFFSPPSNNVYLKAQKLKRKISGIQLIDPWEDEAICRLIAYNEPDEEILKLGNCTLEHLNRVRDPNNRICNRRITWLRENKDKWSDKESNSKNPETPDELIKFANRFLIKFIKDDKLDASVRIKACESLNKIGQELRKSNKHGGGINNEKKVNPALERLKNKTENK